MSDAIKDIEDLPGVGPVTAEKLRAAGFGTVEAIAVSSPSELHEVAEAPHIIQRAKLGYIASIMGVTQETLSRIRSKK